MKLAGVQLPRMMSEALADCREHFVAAAGFSFLINILYLAPTLYMQTAVSSGRIAPDQRRGRKGLIGVSASIFA